MYTDLLFFCGHNHWWQKIVFKNLIKLFQKHVFVIFAEILENFLKKKAIFVSKTK